jgi:hypothetical protein
MSISGSILMSVEGPLINEKMPKDKDYENNPLFHLGEKRLAMGRRRGSLNHNDYVYRGKR